MMDFRFENSFYVALNEIEKRVADLPIEEFSGLADRTLKSRGLKIGEVIRAACANLAPETRPRALSEFEGFGALDELLEQEDITEILVNGWDNIWFERGGKLARHPDRFASPMSYRHVLERLGDEARLHLSVERPMAQGKLRGFRVQMIGAELTQDQTVLSLRRHPKNPWTFESLAESGWARPEAFAILQDWIRNHVNFLVVGPTGSGKTSIANACLQRTEPNERALLLEDTQELALPNDVSQRLLTRQDPQGILPEIPMSELVRQSLRLRPDRLVLGEIRSAEAKDFLMALSTGHGGSFGTIHASSAHQALIRLEMLVQLGAPHWGLGAIRRLIYLSLQGVAVVGRNDKGERRLQGLFRISSLEENGLLVERLFDANEGAGASRGWA
ncbi:MAG: CpaF family protein [Bdellovibrionaceae bacterium]|nr:CpaF family protein [Pseudobdellovibrionaceae bacterium]